MPAHVDLEQGVHQHSGIGSDNSSIDDGEGSCYSQFFSANGGSYDEYRFASDSRRLSLGSSDDGSLETVVEIENGVSEVKVLLGKVEVERDCRICHLGLESNSHESGVAIELGCSCKEDLAAAHRHCAEAWFKIKGNKTCEICHSVARNVLGAHELELIEQSVESNNTSTTATVPGAPSEPRSFWRGQRFLNFLLACMVFAFVISWLFHFNVPS